MDTTAVFIFSESSACSASTPTAVPFADVASASPTSRALGPLPPAMRYSAGRGSRPLPGSQNPITVISPRTSGVKGVDQASGGGANGLDASRFESRFDASSVAFFLVPSARASEDASRARADVAGAPARRSALVSPASSASREAHGVHAGAGKTRTRMPVCCSSSRPGTLSVASNARAPRAGAAGSIASRQIETLPGFLTAVFPDCSAVRDERCLASHRNFGETVSKARASKEERMGCEPMSRSAKPRVEGGADRAGRRVSGPGLLRRSREASSARAVPSRVSARGPGTSRGLSPRPRTANTHAGLRPTICFCAKETRRISPSRAFREVEY